MEHRKPPKIEGLFEVRPLRHFRKTKTVDFKLVNCKQIGGIDGVDYVTHAVNAQSPGAVGSLERTWYMHPHQEDNLLVFSGTRVSELYTQKHGKVERIEVSPNCVTWNNEVVWEGPAILHWPACVFHRVSSGPTGSLSINFARRREGFNLRTEFNIYALHKDLTPEQTDFVRANRYAVPEHVKYHASLHPGESTDPDVKDYYSCIRIGKEDQPAPFDEATNLDTVLTEQDWTEKRGQNGKDWL